MRTNTVDRNNQISALGGVTGMLDEGIEPAVTAAMSDRYWNPRRLEVGGLAVLLRTAQDSARPARTRWRTNRTATSGFARV
jgi:hypothetical protein